MKTFFIFLTLSIILPTENSFTQEFSLERIVPANGLGPVHVLYKIDLESGQQTQFFTIEDSYGISYQIKISPQFKYVGLIARKNFEKDSKGVDFYPTLFIVLNSEGKELYKVENVQAFDFSPSESEVVVIDGIAYEGFGFKAKNMKIINIETGVVKKVADVEKENDQDVRWNVHDSLIYTTNYADVNIYNPKTFKKNKSSYKGIYFSPDGKYYFDPAVEGSELKVYDANSNTEVTQKNLNEVYNSFSEWLPGEPLTLVAGEYFKEKIILDVAKQIVKDKIEGEWIGYDKKSKKVFTKKDDKIIQRAIGN